MVEEKGLADCAKQLGRKSNNERTTFGGIIKMIKMMMTMRKNESEQATFPSQ